MAREKDVPALTVVRATWNPISVGMDDWTDACDACIKMIRGMF